MVSSQEENPSVLYSEASLVGRYRISYFLLMNPNGGRGSGEIEYDGRGHFEGQDFYRDATGVDFEERLSGTYGVNPDGSGWSLGIARIRDDGSVKVRSRFSIHPTGSIEFHADAIRGALPSISSEGVLRPE